MMGLILTEGLNQNIKRDVITLYLYHVSWDIHSHDIWFEMV